MATPTYAAECFLCGTDAICRDTDHANRRLYRCPKCQDYEISRLAMGRVATSEDFKSHASRLDAQVSDPPKIFEIVFDSPSGQVTCGVVDRRGEIGGL